MCNLEVVEEPEEGIGVGLEEGIEELAELEGVHMAPESEELEQKSTTGFKLSLNSTSWIYSAMVFHETTPKK